MNTDLATTANRAALQDVIANWNSLDRAAHDLANSKIKMVNLGRRIGIGMQELCGHNQIGFTFFNTLVGKLPEGLTFEAAKKCVKLANAMPEEAKTLEEATQYEQLCLEGAGMIEEPKRLEPHQSRQVSPVTFFFVTFSEMREKVFKRVNEFEAWDEETQAAVKREIERASNWIEEVKAKIK